MRVGYLYVTCLCIKSTPVILSMQVWCQLCSGPCQCPPTMPRCPFGVPLMLDSCACCRVCARQEGEACTDRLPCDTHRGLQCDYSASLPGGPGQCVGVNRIHSSWNTFVYTRAANTSNTKHLCIIITFKSKRQRSIILTYFENHFTTQTARMFRWSMFWSDRQRNLWTQTLQSIWNIFHFLHN